MNRCQNNWLLIKKAYLSQEVINVYFLSAHCLIIVFAKEKESNIRRGFFFHLLGNCILNLILYL